MPNLVEDRTSFTFHAGTVGVPESQAPPMVGRSWHLRAVLDVGEGTAQGVVASMGGRAAGWALWLDPDGRPVLNYRTFEIAELVLTGAPLAPGRHQAEVVLHYDGGGRGRGATISLVVDGEPAEHGRVAATPPAVFSIDETFDIGLNSGSPVGDYPVAYPFRGGDHRAR